MKNLLMSDKYQECSCGSGLKFKFCCYEKRLTINEVRERELIRRASEFPVDRCLITSDWQEDGIAQVFVIRRLPDSRYVSGMFLVDVFCLGLKDTFAQTKLDDADLRRILQEAPPFDEISYEDARSVILGAIEYAARFGFEPHADWAETSHFVERLRPFSHKFTFGHDGKPFYIEGIDDDTRRIMGRLEPLIAKGEADFLLADVPDDEIEQSEIEEWTDEILQLIQDKYFKDARSEIEDMFGEFPGHSIPPFLMGTCLMMEHKAEKAIDFFKQSIALEPTVHAYLNMAAAYNQMLDIEEQVHHLGKVIEMDGPEGQYTAVAKAELLQLSLDLEQTSGLTLSAYLENKERFDTAFEHLSAQRFELAVRGFTHILDVEPRHVQSHGNLGLAYAGLGDLEKAVAHLQQAIKLDPEYQPAKDNLQILLALRPGEGLDFTAMRRIEFYKEKHQKRKRRLRLHRVGA
jgi:tetratricopeptide (TPR) repeat protein